MAQRSKVKQQKANSKRIVIDASVSNATGGTKSTNLTGQHCREVLICIREVCHQLVLTDNIRIEWEKHSSNYAIEWRAEMRGMKKGGVAKTHGLKHQENASLRTQIAQSTPGVKDIMLKDVHLIEAALAADKIIIALDNQARHHFAELCRAFSQVNDEIGDVIWVHPDEEDLLEWLRSGAEPQNAKKLCHYT